MTLDALEYLQDQLLDGAESNYDHRLPNTVNSMLGAIMAFVRYAYDHDWIDRVPPLCKLDVDEVMRGRPITSEEFEQMLAAVPKVVGEGPAEEWRFAMKILWESGFRIGGSSDFSWDYNWRIHPVWPRRTWPASDPRDSFDAEERQERRGSAAARFEEALGHRAEGAKARFVISPPPARV